jgi:hypothetical protein
MEKKQKACIDCPIARKEIKMVDDKKQKPSGRIVNRGMNKTEYKR